MKKFGLIIFFIGIGLLAGVVLFDVIRDIIFFGFTLTVAGMGGVAIFLGLIIMIISLIMERIRDSKEENYVDDNN